MSVLEVRNPRTGVADYQITAPTASEIAAIVAAARAAQPAWEALGPNGRADALRALGDALNGRRAEVFDALVADTGRSAETHMEIDAVLGGINRWADRAPELLAEPERRPAAIPFVGVGQGYRPYPVVGIISPWNFPLLLALIDAVPALAAGCAVIVKPSEITPRFIEPLTAAISEVPALAGVLHVVAGAGEAGRAIIDEVDAVCFTGSVATGRKVGEQAAARFIPAFLELGGKDPAIVLAGADLDRAAGALLWGSTANCGQSCQSIERIYVDASIHDELVDRLVAAASKVILAHPDPDSGQIGPIISAAQVDIIGRHLADAVAKGAVVRCGGEIVDLDGGKYLAPTVLTNVDHTMAVMTEETFGPIMPVMAVDGVEGAVAAANDSEFGLSAAVFAGTVDEALAVARRLDAGGVSINDAALTALVHDGEKHSFKGSGLGGSRMGPASLWRFVRKQAYLVNTLDGPDPWWH